MPRIQSQIPRLKPASSCGNLAQLAAKDNSQRSHHGSRSNLNLHNSSHHGSRSNLNLHNSSCSDRAPMINAPTPVTHRRMYPNHFVLRPPWAIDETISPFDREPEVKKKTRNYNKPPQLDHDKSMNNLIQPICIQVDSPTASLDYTQNGYPRDEFDGLQSPFENDSYYKPKNHQVPTPHKQIGSCQTDLTGMNFNFIPEQNNKGFQTVSPAPNRPEKKLVLPLKELKRTNNNKNNLTYKITKNHSTKDPVDLNKIFNTPEISYNKTDDDNQSRINYWLNKNISIDHGLSNNSSHSSFRSSPVSPAINKPIFRNQITFTPRPVSGTFSENVTSQNLNRYSSNPQIIEAVILQSDSESDKDYIVSSRSIENKLNRPNSHFTIRANLSSKSKSFTNDISNSSTCAACNQSLLDEDQVKFISMKCHRNCFKCTWCKKKLSIDNYKVNANGLCCPLHYRLSSN